MNTEQTVTKRSEAVELRDLKVFVVNGSSRDSQWTDFRVTNDYNSADVVLFTGGQDINPKLYGEECGRHTSFSDTRDNHEVEIMKKAIRDGKFIVGICRGHQLLAALSGAKLIQDVTGHHGRHVIQFNDGDLFGTNSTHHQMVYPFNIPSEDYEILAHSSKNLSSTYTNSNDEEIELPEEFVEVEAIYFKRTKAFGVQYHPEMMQYDAAVNVKTRKILKTIINNYYATKSSRTEESRVNRTIEA